jgi:hypothetical protein
MIGYFVQALTGRSALRKTLRRHFGGVPLGEIVTAAREFPITSRVDVETALNQLFANRADTKLLAVHSPMNQETPTLAHLFTGGPFPMDIGPLQYDEVDWSSNSSSLFEEWSVALASGRLAVCHSSRTSDALWPDGGVHVEIAIPAGEGGAQFSQESFRDLELRVGAGRTYRGRVISLESYYDPPGRGGAVNVHRLHKVNREDVILPDEDTESARPECRQIHCGAE